jgi:Bacteriocin-protection, YdeI or OmpD-Associated
MDNQLIKKLKLKDVKNLCLLNAPAGFKEKLSGTLKISTKMNIQFDVIISFIKSKSELEKLLPTAKKSLQEKAMLWVCYPKQTSKIKSDINRDSGWRILEQSKLRPVAFISIDETWTAFGLRNEKILEKKIKAVNPELEKLVNKENKIVMAPADLEFALKKNRNAKVYFELLSYSHKKEYVEWIVGAKKSETRIARIKGTIQKLNSGKKNPSDK